MLKHEPTRQPFEGLALETIEKLSAFVLCARHKAFKSSNEAALLAQYDLASWCEHINAHLAFTIDVAVCPKGDTQTVEAAHQLAERWILSYEPSGAKPDSERPLPKLDALSFLIRSLGGYAGSMPLHTLLKDPVRFTFLYGTPSPSCCSLKELTFHERPSVFLFAPLKTPSGTFTFSVKFNKTLSLSEENEYNIIIQPSCSGTTYTCAHGISPPSTPVSIVPRTEIRHSSPPVNIPKKRPQQQQQQQKTEDPSSPYGSPFAYNFLTAAASQPTTSASDDKNNAEDPSALPEAPQGIQRPLSYSSKKAFSCSPLYSSPPPIRRSAITHDRPGATKLRDSGRAKGKEDTDSDDDEDRLSVSPLRKSFTKGSEKEFLAALPSTRLGPSPSDLLGPFVGSFEESILNGRMCDTPSTLFEGFSYDVAVSGKNYASKHIRKDFVAIFYHVQEDTPYVGTLDLQCKNKLGMRIPIKGVLQATIFNPTRTPIKTFLAKYDLTDMPPGTKTFIRQKMVTPGPPSILRYALHLRFACTAKKKFYLRNDVRVLFPHRMPDDMDGLKIIYDCPDNPKYFPD